MWRIKNITVILLLIMPCNRSDVIDYTRENYILIDNGDAVIFEDYGDIFHITNLTFYETIIKEERSRFKLNTNTNFDYKNISRGTDIEIDLEIDLMETFLKQLKYNNYKKSIDRKEV